MNEMALECQKTPKISDFVGFIGTLCRNRFGAQSSGKEIDGPCIRQEACDQTIETDYNVRLTSFWISGVLRVRVHVNFRSNIVYVRIVFITCQSRLGFCRNCRHCATSKPYITVNIITVSKNSCLNKK